MRPRERMSCHVQVCANSNTFFDSCSSGAPPQMHRHGGWAEGLFWTSRKRGESLFTVRTVRVSPLRPQTLGLGLKEGAESS